MPRVVHRLPRESLLREITKFQFKVSRIARLNLSDHLAQQEDVSQTCQDIVAAVDGARHCLDHILQHDFYGFSDHALLGSRARLWPVF